MTFKDLCNILYPSLKARCKNKAELFDTLIINSISPKNEIIRTEISKISYKQKSNLVNGTSSFENVAKKIYPAMDFSDLSKIIESEIKGENLDDLIETLNLHNMKVNKDNLSLNIVNELRQIILNNTSNFRRSQIEGTATLRAKLYEEDDGLCPNCGKALSLDSTKENAIVAIALDNFSPDDAQKTIGLCRKCAEKFRNGDIEKDLVEIKTKLENKAQLRKLDGFINLEEQIKNAIEDLLKSRKNLDIKLNLKSLKINQKIDENNEYVFFNKVKSNVVQYFPMLYDLFASLDGEDKNSYEMLSSTIRYSFLNLEKNTNNKEDIFNCLVDKVSLAGNCDRTIAEIIVSYFIQSCEVFNEITK